MSGTSAGVKKRRGRRVSSANGEAVRRSPVGARFYVVELWNGVETDNQHGPFTEQELDEAARRVYHGLADPENTLLLCARVTRRGFDLSPLRRNFLEDGKPA